MESNFFCLSVDTADLVVFTARAFKRVQGTMSITISIIKGKLKQSDTDCSWNRTL